jgi:hypothetical protein
MALRVRAAATISLAAALTAGAGCSPNGSSLARDEGGAAPGGASTSSSQGGAGGTGGAGGAGGTGGDPEPAGPARLTVVNGTVDADEIRLCFVPFPGGSASTPWPETTGLGYGRGAPIEAASGVVPEETDVEVIVLAGDLEPSYGLECAAILAGAAGGEEDPWPTATSVGVLPESALVTERSLLLVTIGCVGGELHTDEAEELACGAGYTPSTPTAGLVAAPVSRIAVDNRIGMQFMQGSLAMPEADVRVLAGDATASPVLAVQSWSVGAIAPYPPLDHYSLASLGVVPEATIELFTTSGSTPVHVASFADAFAASDLSLDELSDGDGIVFVAVGSAPGLAPGGFWNELRYTVVAPSPP